MRDIVYDCLRDMMNPLALVWAVLLVLGFILFWRKKRPLAYGVFSLCLVVWIFGALPIGSSLLGTLEKPYVGKTLESFPKARAIVVLGGAWSPSRNDLAGFNATFSADRFLTGFELLRRGKSSLVLLGGSATEIVEGKPGYSLDMAEWIKSFAVKDAEVIALPGCRSTRDEALKSKEIIQQRGGGQVLLVTSAWHMKRAHAVFRGAGLEVVPVPCDFEAHSLKESKGKWKPPIVPGLSQLVYLDLYLHEWIGWHYYNWKGWIQ